MLPPRQGAGTRKEEEDAAALAELEPPLLLPPTPRFPKP